MRHTVGSPVTLSGLMFEKCSIYNIDMRYAFLEPPRAGPERDYRALSAVCFRISWGVLCLFRVVFARVHPPLSREWFFLNKLLSK